MIKKLGFFLITIILISVGIYVYNVHINHNFKTITKDKVYKSGVIPPGEIKDYVAKYHIKSIVDLRFPGTDDLLNNPEIPEELLAEKNVVEKLKNVNYFNVGSEQVPKQEVLDRFFEVMDDSANYPILIHCYHGDGRAQLFSSVYRIEYEGMSNDEARNKTRLLLKWSSFDDGKPKGEFLKNYKRRNSVK